MKTRKRFISLILIFTLAVSSIPAFAAQSETQNFIDTETFDLSSTAALCETTGLSSDIATSAKKDLPLTMDYSALADAESLEPPAVAYSTQAVNEVQTMYVTSSLEPDNKYKIYNLTVPAGEMIQAEVQIPHTLSADFDVALLRYNAAEGTAYLVAQSAYVTNEFFTDETVAAINTTGEDTLFFVYIMDSGTHTAEDYFTLTVSIGGAQTQEEPNDNALTAYRLFEFTEHDEYAVTSTLNAPIDHDWYVINVDNASEYFGVQMSLADNKASYIIVDSYTFDKTTLTLRKTGSTRDSSILPLAEGDNYFHIYFDRSISSTPSKYTVTFSSRRIPAYVSVVVATDGYCSRPSNQFADGETRYMLLDTAPAQVRVFYYAADGTPVKVNDTIHVEIHNPSWDADFLRYVRGTDSFEGKSNYTVTLDRAGSVRGIDVWYNMVGVTVTSELFGTIMSHASYALVDRYNDNYLEKPCIHNGTCGFK